MAFTNLSDFLNALELAGELVRIKIFVDPKLEIAEITDRISKTPSRNRALLFENTGYDFPVLMNAYGSEKRMCIALGVSRLDDISKEIETLFKLLAGPKESILDKLKVLPKAQPICCLDAKSQTRKRQLPGNNSGIARPQQTPGHYLLAKRWRALPDASCNSYQRS